MSRNFFFRPPSGGFVASRDRAGFSGGVFARRRSSGPGAGSTGFSGAGFAIGGSGFGFGRTIGWREVREGRDGLYDELADWLRRNRARLRSDRGRFSLEPEVKDEP